MPITHLLLAILVAFIWGFNFIFLKLSLDEFTPLFLCALRFLLASIPAVLIIKPPAMPFRTIVLYGFVMFAMQFSFLFLGMHAGMTPGMASLIVQVQVFFSMIFAAFLLKEQPTVMQIVGALVSFLGIGLVAFHLDKNISLSGFIFILAAAASWGLGNLITKKNQNANMFSLVVWGCFVASFIMLAIAFYVEGSKSLIYSYQHMTWIGISSLLYTVYISTLIGYGVWNWLISRYPIGMVVPFILLVPMIGILSSILILDESFERWKVSAGLLVISGLYINIRSTHYFKRSFEKELFEVHPTSDA